MKYLDIKITENKIKEQKDEYVVIIIYVDGKQLKVNKIKKSHMDAPTFADAIVKLAKQKYPDKEFKTFYVVGDNGKKVDGYDFEALRTDKLDPNEVLPDLSTVGDDSDDDSTDTVDPNATTGILVPYDDTTTSEPDDNDNDDQPTTITLIDGHGIPWIKWINSENTEFVKDSRSRFKELTGEELTKDHLRSLLVLDNGMLLHPKSKKMIGAVAGTPGEKEFNKAVKDKRITAVTVGVIALPKLGSGGSTGSGEEGESGLSGEQAGSAPDIADEVYEALSGLGTDETRLINALKRIETRLHLSEILKQYLKKYESKMDDDIINDFKFDLGGFNSEQRLVLDEINDVMKNVGYIIYGNRFLGSMSWHDIDKFKIKGTYVGHDPRPGHGWHMGVILNIGSKEFGITPTKINGYFGTKYGSSYYIGPVKRVTAGPNQLKLHMPLENKVKSRLKSAWLSQELDRYISDNVPNNGKIPPIKVGDKLTKTMLMQFTIIGKANGYTDNEIGDLILKAFPGGEDEMIGIPVGEYIADTINNYKGNKK